MVRHFLDRRPYADQVALRKMCVGVPEPGLLISTNAKLLCSRLVPCNLGPEENGAAFFVTQPKDRPLRLRV
jgi:hypothetical protein